MANYSELLRDPRWQKKRLEIFELDGWRCRRCESKKDTLHVHHLYYIKGKMPWEYDNSALVTYCEECHEECKSVNWQKAFFDLNLTEFDLLEIALQVRLRKVKHEEMCKEVHEKHKCRSLYLHLYFNLFESHGEMTEYYSEEVDQIRGSYYHGKALY